MLSCRGAVDDTRQYAFSALILSDEHLRLSVSLPRLIGAIYSTPSYANIRRRYFTLHGITPSERRAVSYY